MGFFARISALSGRFDIPRAYVRKLLLDAQTAGLIERAEADEGRLVVSPALAKSIRDFLTTALLYMAQCAHQALDAIGPERE